MNVYYLFRISTKQLKNVFLPGRPLFIDFHRAGEMEVCHHLFQAMGLEVYLNIFYNLKNILFSQYIPEEATL